MQLVSSGMNETNHPTPANPTQTMHDDEKRPIPSYSRPAPPAMRRSTRPLAALAAVVLLGCLALWRWEPAALRRGVEDLAAIGRPGPFAGKELAGLVPLEAHIMSKCPDAKVRARAGELDATLELVDADCDGAH